MSAFLDEPDNLTRPDEPDILNPLDEQGIHFFTSSTCGHCKILKQKIPFLFNKKKRVVFDDTLFLEHTIVQDEETLLKLKEKGYNIEGVPTVYFVKGDDQNLVKEEYRVNGNTSDEITENLIEKWTEFSLEHATSHSFFNERNVTIAADFTNQEIKKGFMNIFSLQGKIEGNKNLTEAFGIIARDEKLWADYCGKVTKKSAWFRTKANCTRLRSVAIHVARKFKIEL